MAGKRDVGGRRTRPLSRARSLARSLARGLVDLGKVLARDALSGDKVEARVAEREVRLRDGAHCRFRDLLDVGAGNVS